jgi:ArsR family transcriptional regulator, arsenate/arsenite/antimonite-responsive transcriptional repressor
MRPKPGQNAKNSVFHSGFQRSSRMRQRHQSFTAFSFPCRGFHFELKPRMHCLKNQKRLDILLYFRNNRNMKRVDPLVVTRTADRFSALGAEPRLQIMRSLLASHPSGMIVGEVQEELDIPASTLSHHLEKLKQVGLVNVRREGTFLWYSANTDALREVLGFLYEECCTRSRAVAPEEIVQISK